MVKARSTRNFHSWVLHYLHLETVNAPTSGCKGNQVAGRLGCRLVIVLLPSGSRAMESHSEPWLSPTPHTSTTAPNTSRHLTPRLSTTIFIKPSHHNKSSTKLPKPDIMYKRMSAGARLAARPANMTAVVMSDCSVNPSFARTRM
jgi:hypothetical protein